MVRLTGDNLRKSARFAQTKNKVNGGYTGEVKTVSGTGDFATHDLQGTPWSCGRSCNHTGERRAHNKRNLEETKWIRWYWDGTAKTKGSGCGVRICVTGTEDRFYIAQYCVTTGRMLNDSGRFPWL